MPYYYSVSIWKMRCVSSSLLGLVGTRRSDSLYQQTWTTHHDSHSIRVSFVFHLRVTWGIFKFVLRPMITSTTTVGFGLEADDLF
jgi:hypothetical protein